LTSGFEMPVAVGFSRENGTCAALFIEFPLFGKELLGTTPRTRGPAT
jgi:hypothetical protein